ncbi:MAG: MFS transporter [Propionibacteriales bacterium]|nr:MFS transporter [Propionibacteriales bacterium]
MTLRSPSDEAPEPAPEPAGRREWIGLAVLALPALLASLELTVTNLALPSIGRDLVASSTQLLWTVDIYAFLLSGSLITMGAWGDRVGRRRVLLIGAAGYGAASLLAAYAVNIEMLIAARALMGVAGATLMPSTLTLTAALFAHPRQRATAIGVIIASVSGGTAIGPLVGGWLLDRFWWGSAFLLAVPVMVLLLLLVPVLLPEHRGPDRRRLDIRSALLSIAAVLPIVYGVKQIAAGGADVTAVLPVVGGIAMAAIFVDRQRRLADPFIDLSLFRNRIFATAAATLALGIFVLWGSNYAIAQYLQLVEGLTPLDAGLWTAPSALGVIAGSTLAPRLAHRYEPTRIIGTGLVLSTIGYAVLTQVGGHNGLAILVTGAVIVSAGLGPMMALATDMLIGAAPPERAGAAAAISTTAPQLGGALGIAVLGSVITATYRRMVDGAASADAPDTAVTAFEDNLSATSAASEQLAEPLATQLLNTARDAFVTGFQLAAVISAMLMAGTAALIIVRGGQGRSKNVSDHTRD